jgi:hypothetical protein
MKEAASWAFIDNLLDHVWRELMPSFLTRSMTVLVLPLTLLAAAAAHAEGKSESVDNGTDPTQFSRTLEAKGEHLDLRDGFKSDTLRLSYTEPLGAKKDYSLRLRVPVASVDVAGNDDYDIGDASLMLSHVFGLTRAHGFVLQGEMIFDTADRPELGTGKDVFKGTLIYAKFLQGGAIFAPAVVQSNSVAGDSDRADVNTTTVDFYYVPKLQDPRNLVTFDPAMNFDWENDLEYASLAITFGRVIGKVFGGNSIVSVKPQVLVGGDRPVNWGIEVGYKVIGF